MTQPDNPLIDAARGRDAAPQAEVLRLAGYLRKAVAPEHPESNGIEKAANELERQHARIAELEAQQAAPQMPDQFHTALDRFDAYFRSANGVPPNARISVPTAEWQELRAMLAAQAAPGWKLVPVEATRAMIDAMREAEESGYSDMHSAALAAAPTPPAA